MGFHIDKKEEGRLGSMAPKSSCPQNHVLLLECRFPGPIFRESLTGGSGARPENLHFNKCPRDFMWHISQPALGNQQLRQ